MFLFVLALIILLLTLVTRSCPVLQVMVYCNLLTNYLAESPRTTLSACIATDWHCPLILPWHHVLCCRSWPTATCSSTVWLKALARRNIPLILRIPTHLFLGVAHTLLKCGHVPSHQQVMAYCNLIINCLAESPRTEDQTFRNGVPIAAVMFGIKWVQGVVRGTGGGRRLTLCCKFAASLLQVCCIPVAFPLLQCAAVMFGIKWVQGQGKGGR